MSMSPVIVERYRDHEPWMQDGYYWSTPISAAFIIAIIIAGLLLGGLLTLVIELR